MSGPTLRCAFALRAAALRPLACILALLLAAGGCAGTVPSGPRSPSTDVRVTVQPAHEPAAGPASFELVLLGTTDVHGRLVPHDYYTGLPTDHGLALLKPLADSIRAANPGRTYVFDSGDLLQGNPIGFVYARVHDDQPNPIIRAMDLLAYDASAIGNHEFNYGLEHLGRAIEQAPFPFVSANIFRHGTDEHAYQPYVLIPHVAAPHDTVLIGVTGNTPPGVHLWDRANVEGELDFRDVIGSLQTVVAEMRGRGADIVIVLSHGGLDGTSYDTAATGLPVENAAARVARDVPGVDVIFLGHTHRELTDSIIAGPAGPVLLLQAGPWARSLAVATLELRRGEAGRWAVTRRSGELLRARAEHADRGFIDSLRWEHERTIAWVNSRIGRAAEPMSAAAARVRDTPIIDFINEVQRAAGNADLSATAAFNISAGLDTGAITIAHAAALYPYDNTLQVIRITGDQLKQYLEKAAEYFRGWPAPGDGPVIDPAVPGYNFDIVSGVEYALDISRPIGERVVGLTHRARPVRADQSFTLALNNYRAAGGGGYSMIRDAPVVLDLQQDIRELLIEEVRRRGTLRPDDYFEESWRLLPVEAANAVRAEQAPASAVADEATRTPLARPRLRVLMTNDFHGRLLPETPTWADGAEVGGAAVLAAYFAAERDGFAGPTILLDGGDVMQGTPVSNLTEGRSAVEYYNAVGYHAAAIGNHEFDWSIPVLRDRIEQAEFAWLSANVFVAGHDTAPTWARPTAVLDVDGVTVGVVGLSTESTPWTTMPSNVRDLEFRDGAEAMDRWVPELRRQGADFVIAVAHAGATCQDAPRSEESRALGSERSRATPGDEGNRATPGSEGDRATPGSERVPPSQRQDETVACFGEIIEWAHATTHKPDLIVGGHAHQVVRTRANGIPIIQAGSYGTRYGVVDLERVTPDSVAAWIRGTPVAWPDRVEPDTAIAALVERHVLAVGPAVDRVVARLAEPLRRGPGEHALGRLIADAQRAATGADVAIMNNGGIRTNVAGGDVTWRALFELQPFGNLLVKLRLTGSQLRTAIEHVLRRGAPGAQVSGLVAEYDPEAPAGERVRAMRLASGEPINDTATYTVTANNFMAEGGDGFAILMQASERDDTGIVDLDALTAYLESLPQPVAPPVDTRLRPVPPERREQVR